MSHSGSHRQPEVGRGMTPQRKRMWHWLWVGRGGTSRERRKHGPLSGWGRESFRERVLVGAKQREQAGRQT